MTSGLLVSALLIAASVGPTVERIDDETFRVKIVFDNTKSGTAHANAQMALMRKARAECRGNGSAKSEGPLHVNAAPPIRGDREALELVEVYRCVRD
jgi:hypothetical protein